MHSNVKLLDLYNFFYLEQILAVVIPSDRSSYLDKLTHTVRRFGFQVVNLVLVTDEKTKPWRKVDFHLVQNVAHATAASLKLNRFLLDSILEL